MPRSVKSQTQGTATLSDLMAREIGEVRKADPQLGSVLANIQSLLQQAKAMTGADQGQGDVAMEDYIGPTFTPGSASPKRVEGGEAADPDDTQIEPTDGMVDPDKKKVVRARAAKAIIVGDPDASTGSGEADERIEDIPETDEENIDAIAKSIVRMLQKGVTGGVTKSVQRARPTADTGVARALAAVASALTTVAKNQTYQGQVIEDILEGLGVTKGLDAQAQASDTENRPVQGTDQGLVMKEFVNALASAMRGQGAERPLNPAETVRKDMSGVARGLAQMAGGLWNPE